MKRELYEAGTYCSLFSGGNDIEDVESIDSLNLFPNLMVSITFLNKW